MTLKDMLNKELAEFERLTGTGNLKHANHVLARIIKQLMLMIETNNPATIDSTLLMDQGFVGFGKDGVLRNVESFNTPISDTPTEKLEEFNQIPVDTFLSDDEDVEWNLPQTQPITEEVIDRAEKADAEELSPNPPLGAHDPDELDNLPEVHLDQDHKVFSVDVGDIPLEEIQEKLEEIKNEFAAMVTTDPEPVEVELTEDDPTDEPPNEPVEEELEPENEHKPTRGRKKSTK